MTNGEHKSICNISIKKDDTLTVALANITFNDGTERKYEVVTLADIQSMIKHGKDICINDKYVYDFSYADLFPKKDGVLCNFNAKNSFFDGKTDFSDAIFDGSVSFSNAMFGDEGVDFKKATFKGGSIDFESAIFGKGGVSFKEASFGEGTVSFSGATFGEGRVSFEDASFGEGTVSFSGVTFGEGDVSFNSTNFGEGKVSFSGCKFSKGTVSFEDSKFGEGEVSFNDVVFGDGDVVFEHVKFGKGDVSFTGARFGEGSVYFDNAVFGEGDISFAYSRFKNGSVYYRNIIFGEGNVSFVGVKVQDAILYFNNASFASSIDRKTIFSELETNDNSYGTISFVNCVILISIVFNIKRITTVSFENCTNSGVIDLSTVGSKNISCLRFINLHNLGALYMNWDSLKESLKIPKNKDSESILADEMKMLKENFHNQGYYDWEDEAYVKYMNHHCNTMSLPKGAVLKLFGLIGGYGTKPLSVFLWMFIVVLAFGILYCLMGSQSITNNTDIYRWWSPFYYSAITFLTVGYGDLSAQTGRAALLAGLEGFLGVFLMSYFSVSLVRKTLR